MVLFELFMIALGLSMDAFAVSICKGLSMKKLVFHQALIVGLYFGIFQAIMPLLGYVIGAQFQQAIVFISHWIAFILLTLIGISMIRESLNHSEEVCDCSLAVKGMVILAVATSIDALAVGITFAFLNVKILPAIIVIGLTTFILSIMGVKAGNLFGAKYKNKAECFGGIILIIMGSKILFEHLFF